MLTPFGKALRILRVEKGMRLLDIAEKTGRSIAFVSAVETGRKQIPDGFLVELSRAMDLSAPELRKLRAGADQTRKEVRVDKLPGTDRELVAAFARQLDEVSEDAKARLRKLVLKSVEGEMPFHRARRGMVVPPMSIMKIRKFCEKVRDAFTIDEIAFPIMDILEFRLQQVIPDFYLDIRSQETMGSLEGMVVAGVNRLTLRQDVYDRAWRGVGRDRFTATHEFGHLLLHRNVGMARVSTQDTKIFEDSEWQADSFAGSLMFSTRHIHHFSSAEDAGFQCGMTHLAARVMWAKYEKEGLIGGNNVRR